MKYIEDMTIPEMVERIKSLEKQLEEAGILELIIEKEKQEQELQRLREGIQEIVTMIEMNKVPISTDNSLWGWRNINYDQIYMKIKALNQKEDGNQQS